MSNKQPHKSVEPLLRNCSEWCRREGVSLTALAALAGRKHGFFNSLKSGTIQKLDALMGLSEVMGVSLQDLVSPSFRIGKVDAADRSKFADHVLELAAEYAEARNGFHKPSAKRVLEWLVRSGSEINVGDPMVAQIEVFSIPDRSEPLPRPIIVGHQSLMSMEAGVKAPEHLTSLIKHSEVDLMRDIAGDQLHASDGRPSIDRKGITLETQSSQICCEYDRLLAPAWLNGERVVINYSVAVNWRNRRINHANELDAVGSRQPMLTRGV